MSWTIEYLPEARDDFRKLDGSLKIPVRKAIQKAAINPLPVSEQGYGKPLGNHNSKDLSGFYKIKLRQSGVRIVYGLKRSKRSMTIIIIGMRRDEEVYKDAEKRIKKYNLK